MKQQLDNNLQGNRQKASALASRFKSHLAESAERMRCRKFAYYIMRLNYRKFSLSIPAFLFFLHIIQKPTFCSLKKIIHKRVRCGKITKLLSSSLSPSQSCSSRSFARAFLDPSFDSISSDCSPAPPTPSPPLYFGDCRGRSCWVWVERWARARVRRRRRARRVSGHT